MPDVETMSVDELIEYLATRTPRMIIAWERISNDPKWKNTTSVKWKGDLFACYGMSAFLETAIKGEMFNGQRFMQGSQPD